MNEILDQLRSTFAASFGGTIKTYFKGRLAAPSIDDLPILSVFPISTVQTHSGTLRDKVKYSIGVEIFVNFRKYVDNSTGQGTQLDTLDALIDLVEERESDGDAKDATVLGILADNLTVGSKVLYTDNYSVVYGDPVSGENSITAKVTVTFDAFDRPNRQN